MNAPALLLLAWVSAAVPSDFDRFFDGGVRLYKSLDYERSLEQFRLAKAQPHGADQDLWLSLYEGVILYELGKPAEAEEAFRAALVLSPDVALPVNVSPLIQRAFDAQRAELRKLNPPPAKAEPAPVAPSVQASVKPPEPGSSSHWAVGGACLGGAAVAAALGTVFGVQAKSAAGDWRAATNPTAWQDARNKARSTATGANVSWGVAGALAVASTVFFIVQF